MSSLFVPVQVVVEYLEEAFAGAHLMPTDPATRARVRQWTAFAGDKIIPHYYKMLMSQDPKGQQIAKDEILSGLKDWTAAMAPEEQGPFFLGPAFSMADVAVAPWMQRLLSVSKAYRGFEIPDSGEFKRLYVWWENVKDRASVADTIVDEKRMLANYSGYADNSATSTEAKKHQK
jgi:glutathione S-transferase